MDNICKRCGDPMPICYTRLNTIFRNNPDVLNQRLISHGHIKVGELEPVEVVEIPKPLIKEPESQRPKSFYHHVGIRLTPQQYNKLKYSPGNISDKIRRLIDGL